MKVLFILATHGNEGFSIPIFEKIEKEFSRENYSYDWIVGNPKALEKNSRFIDVDMNRVAPGSIKSSNYEERRVLEIIAMAENFDFVIDIHGALSACGICTIVSLPRLNNLVLASLLNCENNVIWNSKQSLAKGPINQHIGRPSIELECGPKGSEVIDHQLYETITKFLHNKDQIKIFDENNKWYTVLEKLNKNDYKEYSLKDFVPYDHDGKTIIPFLSNNTYPDGSFYTLETINFEKLFILN